MMIGRFDLVSSGFAPETVTNNSSEENKDSQRDATEEMVY